MNFFNTPVKIKDLEIKNRVFLAPLAGVSDIPFRRICQSQGAGLTYVEMLSATAIRYNSKRTFEMMARHASESILGVQVTGPNADEVSHAVSILDKQGFETIDVNMGCPVRKVVGSGCGSAILKDPERVSETMAKCRVATSKPLSAKIRLGYTREAFNVMDTVSRLVSEHVDMFTIHGRTRSESYSTPCDLGGIRMGMDAGMETMLQNRSKEVIKVGNGDVFGIESAQKMRLETGCDAVMVSRGALGNPWVFQEILSEKTVQPTFEEWLDLVMNHIDYQQEHFGNRSYAAILMRKHLLWYAKGFPESKSLRDQLNQVETLEQARLILKDYTKKVPPGFVRYEGFSSHLTSDYDPKYEMDRQLDRGVGDEGMA